MRVHYQVIDPRQEDFEDSVLEAIKQRKPLKVRAVQIKSRDTLEAVGDVCEMIDFEFRISVHYTKTGNIEVEDTTTKRWALIEPTERGLLFSVRTDINE